VVVSAHDGEPDMTPGILSNNLEAPTGNHVFLQLETGTYLVIAHLKQGSLTVKTGETVQEGQIIGQCGNSGNTSEPHIHIHHQRQDPTVYPLNFAEGLPLYFRDHDGQRMPVGGVRIEGDKAIATGDLVRHIGK
jgi:murein DD-endopeptidase MepM/ murein hydrolase activator NlpD